MNATRYDNFVTRQMSLLRNVNYNRREHSRRTLFIISYVPLLLMIRELIDL